MNPFFFVLFFFNDTATTEIYTLSLHDALPIRRPAPWAARAQPLSSCRRWRDLAAADRKSTRLNSSHLVISYAVFCLKNKKTTIFMSRTQKKKKKNTKKK